MEEFVFIKNYFNKAPLVEFFCVKWVRCDELIWNPFFGCKMSVRNGKFIFSKEKKITPTLFSWILTSIWFSKQFDLSFILVILSQRNFEQLEV
jgi:hypothetical protein